jgi:hypothetical protein
MKRVMILVAMLVAVAMIAPAKSKTYKSRSTTTARTPVVAYTLAGCPDCAAFKQYLRQSGVHYTTTHTRDRNVSLFPTVVYSDGQADNGERISGGQAKLPKAIRLIETD